MSDILLVSETMRFPFRRHRWQMWFLRAKIYMIDWAQRKIVKTITSPEAYHVEEFSSLKRSYHYHGARGITSNGQHIFVAAQNVLLVFDHNLKLLKRIQNKYFNGLHEIDWRLGQLYVTCAVTDAILVLGQDGSVQQTLFLGDNPFFTETFKLTPRTLDNRLDYRVMHKCQRLYHVNSVQATDNEIYAGFNHQGAFVKVYPTEDVLIAGPELKGCHNAQFTPDGNYILINDTEHYRLQVFARDTTHLRSIDLHQLGLPLDLTKRSVFGEGHEIRAGWLRGMAFSSVEREVVFLGLSPTSVAALNYLTGELVDFLKIRKNVWITVHGLHNLSLERDV